MAEPSRLLLLKLMVNCWASGICEVTCTAKSDWYLPGNMRAVIWLRISGSVGERGCGALVGKQLCGDLGAGIHHRGVDQVTFLHAVEQRVAVGGLAVLAAERGVGVQRQPALGLQRH